MKRSPGRVYKMHEPLRTGDWYVTVILKGFSAAKIVIKIKEHTNTFLRFFNHKFFPQWRLHSPSSGLKQVE